VLEASATTIHVVHHDGRIALLGITGTGEISVAWDSLVSRAVSVLSAYSSRDSNWEAALHYLAASPVVMESAACILALFVHG
jgi:hypothetical protein